MMKFGAMLIVGSSALQWQPAAAEGTRPAGRLWYSPMMVYAKSRVLSKRRMTAKSTKSAVGIQMPDFFGGSG